MLIGAAIGALIHCIDRFSYYLLPSWLGYPELVPPESFTFNSIMGIRLFVGELLVGAVFILLLSLGEIFLFFILRVLLRNQKAAMAAWVAVVALIIGFENIWTVAISLIISTLALWVLVRFWASGDGICNPYSRPFFIPGYFGCLGMVLRLGFAALAIFAAIILYAFRISLGGRPLIGTPNLTNSGRKHWRSGSFQSSSVNRTLSGFTFTSFSVWTISPSA